MAEAFPIETRPRSTADASGTLRKVAFDVDFERRRTEDLDVGCGRGSQPGRRNRPDRAEIEPAGGVASEREESLVAAGHG